MEWEQRRTLILVNLAGIMERADEALLLAVYNDVGAALHATPAELGSLGSLTLFRSMVQSACYPLAVFVAARYNRCHVIAVGAFLWAAATFLVALSGSFLQVAISRAFNGVGLALVTPAILSLVADSTDDSNRGTAFGWLQLTSNIGSIIGGFFSLLLASTSVVGIEGWRVAFHLVGIISVLVGILVFYFAVDPYFSNKDGGSNVNIPPKSLATELRMLFKEAKAVMKIPSFQIIVAQGVSGSFPWSALAFAPMWLELIGFSHEGTGFLMAMFVVANSLGSLFGGKMGDYLSKRFPNSGRIVLSQISSGSAIPLAAVLLLALPDDPSTGIAHGLVLFIMGFSISWNGPATNKEKRATSECFKMAARTTPSPKPPSPSQPQPPPPVTMLLSFVAPSTSYKAALRPKLTPPPQLTQDNHRRLYLAGKSLSSSGAAGGTGVSTLVLLFDRQIPWPC